MDSDLHRLVKDLRCAVAQALADSTDVGEILRRVRQEGWSLYLVVDRKGRGEAVDAYEVGASERPEGEVVFKIDGQDLSFLRSIGIDPTRAKRGRKPSS